MKKTMLGFVSLALVALFTTSSANADQWNLVYSGTGASGNITFTDTPLSNTLGQITSATGTINGATVTGLSNWWGADNKLITTGSFFADSGGIGLTTTANITYNLWNNYGAGMVASNTVLGPIVGTGPNIAFTLTPVTAPVPEPTEGALLLSGIGLMGFIAARRKNNA